MDQGNKKSTKVLAIIIVALLVFVGIGAIVIGNMNANQIKKEEPAVEVSEVSSSSSSKKETSSSVRDENTANTIEIKSDGGTVSRVEEPAPRQRNVSSDSELYTPDGVLRFDTKDPTMIEARKALLKKWGELADSNVSDDMIRLYEQPNGFVITAGGVGWGGITDNGNNSFTFTRRIDVSHTEILGTATVNF